MDQLKSKSKSQKMPLERCGNEIYDFSICICRHKVISLSPNTTKKKSGLTHIRTIVILKKMGALIRIIINSSNNSNNKNNSEI